ncbi:hypothetical protein [Fuerstiella marisgermanici]|uniref:Uncharacterized protein n=1 Tax=Fuerstiella marisgermanici TaxID=1891926 RepID=A0A1P8WDP2_9PLAN|nr:hypothetical protein [Fuerstiella marisgermanici]APZ92164.1 hypothetical protein Fuma_01772 [Fuerstiella marisgermanici]
MTEYEKIEHQRECLKVAQHLEKSEFKLDSVITELCKIEGIQSAMKEVDEALTAANTGEIGHQLTLRAVWALRMLIGMKFGELRLQELREGEAGGDVE